MITAYPLCSLTAIHGRLFHIHGRLTVSSYLDLDVLQGKSDRAGVLDFFHQEEGRHTISSDPCTSLGGEVIC